MKISALLNENEKIFSDKLNIECNLDIIQRRFKVGQRSANILFIEGFIKEDTLSKLFESFINAGKGKMPQSAADFLDSNTIFGDSFLEDDVDEIITRVLSGDLCVMIDGYDRCVIINFREFVQRPMVEPEKEKVARGSKDGFVEMLTNNLTLLRRRIRDRRFCSEMFQIGNITKTDVAVCYIADIVDKKLLMEVRKRICAIDTDGLTMNQQTLSNLMSGNERFNPFPKFRYTERPDTACAQLMHGDVLILVDNSPFATVLPVSLFDIMEDANDYYFPPVTGVYLRLVRYITAFVTTFLTPLWLLFLRYPDWIPPGFDFILLDKPVFIPVVWQLIILEISIDGLKLASLNIPTMMSTTLSVLGGIVVGDLAVKTGWMSVECLFYMGFVALANFSMPSYEMSYALKFSRIVTLVLTSLFGVWGFVGGFVLMILAILLNKTFLGYRFLYPLIPFDAKKIKMKIRKVLGYNDHQPKTCKIKRR